MKPSGSPVSMKVREAIARAAERLLAVPGIARLDAELLMASALGVKIGELMLSHLDDPVPRGFDDLIERRLRQEPMGYLLGRVGFWTIELDIGPGVLIPRADSETLIEAAVAHFADRAPRSIVDLGTGPGTLLLAALSQWPGAQGLGIDASPDALAYARANAERLGMADRTELRQGDWTDGIAEQFDLVLCNPPYVEDKAALIPGVVDWEPAIALFGGPDGLDAYRHLAPRLQRLIAPGGVACVEIGAHQEQAVRTLFDPEAVTITSRRDLNGMSRCLVVEADRG
jgi:release factor glutamine methyltransferase